MSEAPQISVLIPCYNGGRWITACIESALALDWPKLEVIVLDDGSTDDSRQQILAFGERVRTILKDQNEGGNRARNDLLKASSGVWIQYLDADDYLERGKVRCQLEHALANEPCDVVVSPTTMEEYEAGELANRYEQVLPDHGDCWEYMLHWQMPQTGGILFRKAAIVEAGAWDESFSCAQDSDLCARMLIQGYHFRYLEDHQAVYRIWSEETVSRKDPRKVCEAKLGILDRCERYLRKQKRWNETYQDVANQTRFGIARMLYGVDVEQACALVEAIFDQQPDFEPEPYYSSALYRIGLRLLGFRLMSRLQSMRSS